MLTRRELLATGGLALVGRLLPFLPRIRVSPRSPVGEASEAEIAMRTAGGGARVRFDPVGLHVTPGTTVRWVRVEGVHTATAYHPSNGDLPRRIPAGARPWDSGYLTEPGATFEVTLEAEGVYDYFCRPHEAAGMAGRIVVSDGDRSAAGGAAAWRGAEPDDRIPGSVRETLPPVEAILERGRVAGGGRGR